MPRKLRARPKKKPACKPNPEPLAEGIIVPLNKHGHRNWISISDEKLVEYAGNFIKEKGITSRKELSVEDTGLYDVLRKRKLLDELSLETKIRDWASISDEELVEHASKFIEKNKIKNSENSAKLRQK